MYLPFYRGAMVTNAAAFEADVDKVLALGFDTLLPCHGSVVRYGARDVFERHTKRGIPMPT